MSRRLVLTVTRAQNGFDDAGFPAAFERAGFTVTAAPMGFILPSRNVLLEWLPSSDGVEGSRVVLKEWLALQIQRFT